MQALPLHVLRLLFIPTPFKLGGTGRKEQGLGDERRSDRSYSDDNP